MKTMHPDPEHARILDTSAMLAAVAGGVGINWINTADAVVNLATHLFGLGAAIVAFVWWLQRLRKVKQQSKDKD